ncbi:MAG TPA: metal ABC transporter permease [Microvirga sp.]|nr:metal ABC transporter permease [Microvirga sp.]
MNEFVQLSLVPMVIGTLSCVSCGLLGNFLVLRRQSMVGDAISHVALPGIVAAFLITGEIAAGPMMVGAAVAAVVAVVLIEAIRVMGRVEPGAAMGVVFTAMFAAGVLLLEQSGSRNVHLDVEHALYGNLESLIWLDAEGWNSLLDPQALVGLPPQLARLCVVTLATSLFVGLLWKELAITTFDPGFADSVGIKSRLVGFALIVMVAIAAVASFDAVGSIIVIAMFVCPAAAARLMTDRLSVQIAWSIGFAVFSASVGYVLAGYGPLWLGARNSVSAAGMIATVAGVILALGCMFGPRRAGLKASART